MIRSVLREWWCGVTGHYYTFRFFDALPEDAHTRLESKFPGYRESIRDADGFKECVLCGRTRFLGEWDMAAINWEETDQ